MIRENRRFCKYCGAKVDIENSADLHTCKDCHRENQLRWRLQDKSDSYVEDLYLRHTKLLKCYRKIMKERGIL